MNKGLTGLEQHEGESFCVIYPFNYDFCLNKL